MIARQRHSRSFFALPPFGKKKKRMFCVSSADVAWDWKRDRQREKKKNFHARKLQEDATRQKRESGTQCPVSKSRLETFSQTKRIIAPASGNMNILRRSISIEWNTNSGDATAESFRRSIDRLSIALAKHSRRGAGQTTSDGNKTHFNSNSTCHSVAHKRCENDKEEGRNGVIYQMGALNQMRNQK